jgi:peptidyl-prolyl cis-trans isomerase-like 4
MKTGDSLNYAFIGFDSEASCEQAYFKMNNVLIDDRRIKVDFSQSVSHLWKQFKRFGRKGTGELAKAAAEHERGAPRGGEVQLECGGGPGHVHVG